MLAAASRLLGDSCVSVGCSLPRACPVTAPYVRGTRTPSGHAALGHGYPMRSPPVRERRSADAVVRTSTDERRPMSTSASSSLWEDRPRRAFPDPLPPTGHVDTLVVG